MRLIDADALMKELEREVELADDRKTAHEIANVVKYFPTIEPQRMRGKWKGYNGEKPDWQRTDGSPVFLICSECGATVVNNFAAKWNYCCVCGAEMGEQNET